MIDLLSPLLLVELCLWFWSMFFALLVCRYSSMILIKTSLNFASTFNYCASGWCWVHYVAILLSMHVVVHCTSEWRECMDTKAVPVHNVKAYRGNGGAAQFLLQLDIILDSLIHRLLYGLERSPLVPTEQETALAPRGSLDILKKKKSLALARIKTADLPAHCLVTILTMLTQSEIQCSVL